MELCIEGASTGGAYGARVDLVTGQGTNGNTGPAANTFVAAPPTNSALAPMQGVAFQFAGGHAPRTARKQIATSNTLGLRCTHTLGRRPILRCYSVDNEETWRIELATSEQGAALASTDSVVAVARFPWNGKGPKTLTTYELRTGRILWQSQITGDQRLRPPPIVDSTQLSFFDADLHYVVTGPQAKSSPEVSPLSSSPRFALSGWTQQGKFIEVFDAVSGRSLETRLE